MKHINYIVLFIKTILINIVAHEYTSDSYKSLQFYYLLSRLQICWLFEVAVPPTLYSC